MNGKVLQWLREWEKAINAADYAAARLLFSPDVVSFGTLAGATAGLHELETWQWRKIWPTIKDFRFDGPIILVIGEPAHSAVVASLWRSKGKSLDGGWYDRTGRATLLLKLENNLLGCCHSHLSIDHGIPPLHGNSSN